MIKNVFIAMDDASAAKFENEFDLADNSLDESAQATSGAFRATDMTRDNKVVYEIVTDEENIAEFTQLMGDFVKPMMTPENLSVHNMNSLFNAYRLISQPSLPSVTLTTKADSQTSQRLQEIFSLTADSSMAAQYTAKGLTNSKTKVVYDGFSISVSADDFSTDTIYRLTRFCEFMDETATGINGGAKPEGEALLKILTEKLGTDWANFYTIAQDQIARAAVDPQDTAAPEGEAEAPAAPYVPTPMADLGDGITEYGVFTADGIHNLPQTWFDQRLDAATKQLIMDRNDSYIHWDDTSYATMASDGVSLEDLSSLIYSHPGMFDINARTSPYEAYKGWMYGTGDAKITSTIDSIKENTRVFDMTIAQDIPFPTLTMRVFIDNSTGFVGSEFVGDLPADESAAKIRTDALFSLYKKLRELGKTDDVMKEYARTISVSGTKEGYIAP